jgi:acetylornithine aminotransferase
LLLMLDEVQTGNGRTGSFFAFQQEGMVPDVLTTAKGLGGGFPIGACLVHGKATDLFGPGNHGSTFGGNPLCSAVALAVIRELETVVPGVNARAESLCAQLRQRLSAFPMVKEVRHRGLMIGIPFDRDCGELVDLARERQLLINVTAGSVVRLLPPLIINDDEISLLCDRLVAAVEQFAKSQEAA